jgi:dTDP-4-amino-4,6-dideoxygalactose transaminase
MKIQRTLAPAAAPLNWKDLLRGLGGLFSGNRAMDRLTREFQQYFGIKHVFWLTSGKAALSVILRGLSQLSSRRAVIIPAYTCFSVPSAVVKAGLSLRLCDVKPESLDFDFDQLDDLITSDVLAIVPTHLFGSPADVQRVRRVAAAKQVYVVEDVAQALGGLREGSLLGTAGDVSFLSFGRGKNVTCGSGGAILTNSDPIAQAIRLEYEQLQKETLRGALTNWMEVLAMQFLITPTTYWFPAGLPFLKLGDTKFYPDFPICRMDAVRAGLLASWTRRLQESTRSRREGAFQLEKFLQGHSGRKPDMVESEQTVYLRYPYFMNDKREKERVCALSQQQGLGITPAYPPITTIPELQGTLAGFRVPGASFLADHLVTLPTHCYVTPQDSSRIVSVLKQAQKQEEAYQRLVGARRPSVKEPGRIVP